MGRSAKPAKEAQGLVAVVATLTKGYDLEHIWKQVDRGAVKDAASYSIQASESGGEQPGRWWGPGAKGPRLRAWPAGRPRALRRRLRAGLRLGR